MHSYCINLHVSMKHRKKGNRILYNEMPRSCITGLLLLVFSQNWENHVAISGISIFMLFERTIFIQWKQIKPFLASNFFAIIAMTILICICLSNYTSIFYCIERGLLLPWNTSITPNNRCCCFFPPKYPDHFNYIINRFPNREDEWKSPFFFSEKVKFPAKSMTIKNGQNGFADIDRMKQFSTAQDCAARLGFDLRQNVFNFMVLRELS